MTVDALAQAGRVGGKPGQDGVDIPSATHLDPENLVAGLFREMAPQVRRWVTYQHGPEVADDVLAETFLVVWRRHAALSEIPAEQRAWVFGIAANVTKQHIRTAIRHRESETRARNLHAVLATIPENEFAESDRVRQLLHKLPPAEREAFTLVAVSDLGPAQVAEVLDCSPGVVRSRLSRARARLAAALRRAGETTAEGRGDG